jgi:hypothetical protein
MGEGNDEFDLEMYFCSYVSSDFLRALKSYDMGPPKEGVLQIFIALKIPSYLPVGTREPLVQWQAS